MPVKVLIRDASAPGAGSRSYEIEFPTESMTVRELIRERVYQEVDDHNRSRRDVFAGLVAPEGAARTDRGWKLADAREIDWKKQFELACDAFEKRRVIVLVGEKQAARLDETVTLARGTEVTFLRLVPLVGG